MFLSRLFCFRAKTDWRCPFFYPYCPREKGENNIKTVRTAKEKGKNPRKGNRAGRRQGTEQPNGGKRNRGNGTNGGRGWKKGQTAAGAEKKARQREKSEGRKTRKQGKTGEEKRAKKRGRRGNSKNGRGAGTGKISRFTNLLQIYYNFYKCIIQLSRTMSV